MNSFRVFLCLACAWVLLSSPLTAQVPQGTTFTYQGELRHNNTPVTASVDMVFTLFDAPTSGTQLGQLTFTGANAVAVSNGIFTVTLDFGGSFGTPISDQRWLEVTANGNVLAPRTQIQSAPYALQSQTAELAYSISNASVGTAQIISSQVQRRIGGTCTVGSSIRAIAEDGTVTCEQSASGTVTSVATDATLSGGPITTSGTLGIAPGAVGTAQINAAQVQQRVGGSCSGNQMVQSVNADGTVNCGTSGSGTVTSIATDATLTGGPISTTGTLGIAPGGVGLAQIDTSQIQARATGVCAVGNYMRGVNADGSAVCTALPATPTVPFVPRITSSWGTNDNLPSVAIGADGLPVMSFIATIGSNHSVVVAKCTDPACLAPAFTTLYDAQGVGGGPQAVSTSIAVGADGLPAVSYVTTIASNYLLWVAKCSSAACTTFSTVNISLDSISSSAPSTVALVASSNVTYVVYEDASNNLRLLKCSSGDCNSGGNTFVTLVAGAGSAFSAVIDGTTVYYAYSNAAASSYFYNCTSGCAAAVTVYAQTVTQPSVSISTNHLSDVIVAFRNHNGNLSVKDVTLGTGARIIDTTSTASNVSTALDSNRLSAIAYRDGGLLKFVKCTTGACNGSVGPVVIDGLPNASLAIALDASNVPILAYADGSVLRVAKCTSVSCQ